MNFVRRWSEKTEISAGRFIEWLDMAASKFYDWRERYGKINEHNGWVPRDFWLEDWERQASIGFHLKNPLEGGTCGSRCRRPTSRSSCSGQERCTRRRGHGSSRTTGRSSSPRTSRSSFGSRACPASGFRRFTPQSNGKIERWHESFKGECIRPGTPLSLEDARRLVERYVDHYNNVGYIAPKDMLAGRQQDIHAERDRKLEAARKQRQSRRQQAA